MMRRLPLLTGAALIGSALSACLGTGCSRGSPPELALDVPENVIRGAETAAHSLAIAGSAEVVKIVLTQELVDCELSVESPAGQQLLTVNSPGEQARPDTLTLRTPVAGTYIIRAHSLVKAGLEGRYTLKVWRLPEDSARDRASVQGELTVTQAGTEFSRASEAGWRNAHRLYLEASETFARAGLREQAANARLLASLVAFTKLSALDAAARDARTAYEDLLAVNDLASAALAARTAASALMELAPATGSSSAAHDDAERWHTSDQYFERAFALLGSLDDPVELALTTNQFGILQFYAHRYEAARSAFVKAKELAHAQHFTLGELKAAQNLAFLDHELGDSEHAAESLDSVAALLEATGDMSGLADVLDNSAEAYLTLGRPDESFHRYFRSLALHEARDDGAGKARSLHGLGVTYLSTGDPERALGFLRQALPLREAHNDHSGLVSTLRTIAAAEIRRGNPVQARAFLERAVTASHTPLDQARSLIALSELELRMQHARRARELVNRVLSLDVPDNHPLLDRARLQRGKAWLALRDAERATSDLESARKAFSQTHQLVLESEALLALANVAETRGSVTDSLGLVEDAIARIERVRERAINPDMRARYLASRAEAFELRTGLLMRLAESEPTADARARWVVQALLSADDVRARTLRDAKRSNAHGTSSHDAAPRPDADALLDRLAVKHAQVARLHEQTTIDAEYVRAQEQDLRLMQAELDLLQGKGVQSGLSLNATGLKSLQARLPPSLSIVVYALATRTGWAWIVRHDRLDVVQVPARGELEQLAQVYYRRESSFTTSGPASRRSGLELSRAVIEPVLPHVAGDRILLAPDGPLHYVPMASLPLPGDNGRNLSYLVEKFEISEFGSLAQLADADRIPSVSPARWKRELLLVADPVYSSADARVPKSAVKPSALAARDAAVLISHPLQALPGTAVEAKAILALFPNAESLSLYGFDATRERLLGEFATGARVIHIATHAYADTGDPRFSYVALSSVDREGGAINGILLAGEIVNSGINADLVTLSACETHIGEPLFGEGLRGLSHAWIQAGARTVIGSLWKVSDDATQVLMRNFYSQLDRGRVRPSRALRAAQLAVLKDDRYSRPYHWASFVPIATSMD